MARVPVGTRSPAAGRSMIASDAVTRINLITNPSFESTYGWVPALVNTTTNSSANVSSADRSLFGTHSAQIIEGDGSAGHIYLHITSIPVTPGATYTISFYVYLTNYTSGGINLVVDDNAFHRIYSGPSTTTVGQWVRLAGSFTIPTSGTVDGSNKIQIIADTGGVPLFTAYIDGVLLEQTAVLDTYFDGSFTGASWSSTPDASTSIFRQPRLQATNRNLA